MYRSFVITCAVLSALTLVACGEYPNNRLGNTSTTTNVTKSAANVQSALRIAPGRMDMGNVHRIHSEQRIADRVVKTGYVSQASVLVVGDTAYIGVVQKPGVHKEMSTSAKAHLAQIVKQFDKRIKTVYISANPDVYTHFRSFAAEIANGKPVSGLWTNFRSIVTRVWPTAR